MRTVKSCGPDASVVGVKSSEACRPDRARMSHIRRRRRQTSPILRGELEVIRKAIAQGMSDVSAEPVCSCAFSFYFIAHETAGAARTRHSLRPLIEAQDFWAYLGRLCRETMKLCLLFEIRIRGRGQGRICAVPPCH